MKKTNIRNAFSIAITVLIAIIFDRYYSLTHEFWMPLSAFLVLYAAPESNLQSSLKRFILVVSGIAIILFLISFRLMYKEISDVVVGGAIGILGSLLIFPHRDDVEFRRAIIPILENYMEYLTVIAIQQKMAWRHNVFPSWVFGESFNPALRTGHQHFLVRVQQVEEILFALSYAAEQELEPQIADIMNKPIAKCLDNLKLEFKNVIAILNFQFPPHTEVDSLASLQAVEQAFKEAIPLPLELLDLSENYINLAEFIYNLKDLHRTLFLMKEALRP